MRIRQYAIRVFSYALPLTLIFVCFVAINKCRAAEHQYTVTTEYTTLVFNSTADMITFNTAINYPSGNSLSFFFNSPELSTVQKNLIHKTDLLFQKVQMILDMRKKIRKVRVRLFSNEEQLQQAYVKIYNKKKNVRGWYVYNFNTVFLNVSDVHEGMLAHELAHAIIDNFLAARPPRATAEILARYVDKHLFEEVKKY